MTQLRALKRRIGELFDTEKTLCLWLSGGSDSTLLLEVMLEQKKPFGILRFDDGWDREQRKQTDAIIAKHNLQVFCYPPSTMFLVGEGAEISLMTGYGVDRAGNAAWLCRDMADNPDRCSIDINIETAVAARAPIEFDIHIWGTRSDDRHWILGNAPPAPGASWQIGNKTFTAPLWGWSREEVRKVLKRYGKYDLTHDTGDIRACTRCLSSDGRVFCPKVQKEIPPVTWDKEKNLGLIREMLWQ